MAIHATPLTAYLNVKNANVEANQRAGAALGNIAQGISDIIYEKNKKQFFADFGGMSHENAYNDEVKEIDSRLEELNKELQDVNGQIAEIESAPEPATGDGSVTSAVGGVYEGLERANKLRGLRDRESGLQEKIANLNDQKAEAQRRASSLKKQRESLTDDEIVRMAKVKGINDDDINTFINARITQRNADLAKQGGENAAAEIKAQQDKNVAEVRSKLYEVQSSLATLANKRLTDEEVEPARAQMEELQNQYEGYLEEYYNLTGKEWPRREYSFKYAAEEPEGPKAPQNGANPPAAAPEIPSDLLKYAKNPKEAAKLAQEYKEATTTEKRRREIISYLEGAKTEQENYNREIQKKRNELTEKGKSAATFDDAMAAARAYCETYGKNKPSRQSILEGWGWDFNTHEKKAK